MKNFFCLFACSALLILAGCGGEKCCQKPCEPKPEIVETCPVEEPVIIKKTPRTSGPLSDKEVRFTRQDFQ